MCAVVDEERQPRVPRSRGRREGNVSWATQNRPSVRVPHPGVAQIRKIDISTSSLGISDNSVNTSEDSGMSGLGIS
jgi:hypothetical protein